MCACAWMRACVRACMCMYVGYDLGVSCVATVVVTDCLWLQLCLINLASTRQQLSDSILLARYFPCVIGVQPLTPISDIMRRYIYFRHNMHDLVDKPMILQVLILTVWTQRMCSLGRGECNPIRVKRISRDIPTCRAVCRQYSYYSSPSRPRNL